MMKKTVVSQGLAYQQPTDDGGHERPPMLFNDGREMPTFRQSDQSALGKLQRHFFPCFSLITFIILNKEIIKQYKNTCFTLNNVLN